MTRTTKQVKATPSSKKTHNTAEKIRWCLQQRLCEQLRHLSIDLVEETSDAFLNLPASERTFGSLHALNLMREIRTKGCIFTDLFVELFDRNIQPALGLELQNATSLDIPEFMDPDSDFEKLELELASQAMQRKAYKQYSALIKQLETCNKSKKTDESVFVDNKDPLIRSIINAFNAARGIFKLPIEAKLIFCKTFEKHLLLNMDKLYQDTINILENGENDKFLEKLLSSTTSIQQRQQKKPGAGKPSGKSPNTKVHSTSVIENLNSVGIAVNEILNDTYRNGFLSSVIADIMMVEWRKVLFLVGASKGMDAEIWNQSTQLAIRLAEILPGDQSKTSYDFNAEEVGELKQQLCSGFSLVHTAEKKRLEFFTEFDRILRRDVAQAPITPDNEAEKTDIVTAHSQPEQVTSPGALSEAGKKILENDDLNDIAALFSEDSDEAVDSRMDNDEALRYYLQIVDKLADGSSAKIFTDDGSRDCRIQKSSTVDGSYQIAQLNGKVILTRSRIGLAVSLREGEVRLSDYSRPQPEDMAKAGNPDRTLVQSNTNFTSPAH